MIHILLLKVDLIDQSRHFHILYLQSHNVIFQCFSALNLTFYNAEFSACFLSVKIQTNTHTHTHTHTLLSGAGH